MARFCKSYNIYCMLRLKKNMRRLTMTALVLELVSCMLFVSSRAVADQIDPALKEYVKVSGVAGNLSSVGSDTLASLMVLWAEKFKNLYPNVNIQVQAPGSSAAPTALTENTANLGPMSRKMKDNEVEAFEGKYGYKPLAIRVAVDVVAIYVNKDNPIKGMTLPQVDAVFSVTRKCDYLKNIILWGELGLKGGWVNRKIQLFGRNAVSGTYGYFKEKVLCEGDFKNTVNEQPGSASVVQGIAKSLNGMGYSSMGYRASGVRAVPLAAKAGSPYVEATSVNAITGKYPLARFLYLYINKHPNKPLPPLEREFIKMILSKLGQKMVIKDGYIPLSAQAVEKELAKINGDGLASTH